MLINNQHFETIWYKQNEPETVQIIDQRKLPFVFSVTDLKTVDDTYTAIKEMYVRGAPLIGVTAAFGMYLAALSLKTSNNFSEEMKAAASRLNSSRPTAINLSIAVERQLKTIDTAKSNEKNIQNLFAEAKKIKQEEIDNCIKIGEFGMPLIEEIGRKKNGETVNILTHCNAGWLACIDYGTATSPIYLAHDKGIKIHVWVDETRPRNQGARLTAYELGQHGVPHTIIPDNTGGHLMQHGMVDVVIVGSDRTTASGDVANKIGTYLKALAAKDNNVPFYVALPSTTFDFTIHDGIKEIPIETRSEKEVTHIEGTLENGKIEEMKIIPEKSTAVNYGFDVTPAHLVTGLITEKGICRADKKSISQLLIQ